MRYVTLPLYSDPDYEYMIALQRTTYKIRLYYNERMQKWIYDLRYADNTPIVLGEAVSPLYPILLDYRTPLDGIIYLEPIGASQNETILNPFELYKYYRLYYLYFED